MLARINDEATCTECGLNVIGQTFDFVFRHLIDHWATSMEQALEDIKQFNKKVDDEGKK